MLAGCQVGAGQLTKLIIYLDDDSRDSVAIFFPHKDQIVRGLETAAQARFKNKWDSSKGRERERANCLRLVSDGNRRPGSD